MAQTKAEVRNRALIKLGALGFGETPDSTISDDMDLVYDEVYERLEQLHLTAWASDENVPNDFVQPLVNLCAQARVTEHGASPLRYQKIMQDAGVNGQTAIGQIRAMLKDDYEPDSVVEFY